MDARRTVVLIDDLRSFVDGRDAEVARTSAAGVELGYRVHIASGSTDVGYLDGRSAG
ncbi:hypothetical protein AB0C15_01855 [Micromonospora sp. NPDC048835]|uniref:hypothetical protein n=1 Tax=Micromonospora sp. NPDC048835 TaxID=3155147 RepID=UPI0033C57B60